MLNVSNLIATVLHHMTWFQICSCSTLINYYDSKMHLHSVAFICQNFLTSWQSSFSLSPTFLLLSGKMEVFHFMQIFTLPSFAIKTFYQDVHLSMFQSYFLRLGSFLSILNLLFLFFFLFFLTSTVDTKSWHKNFPP